ncbi:MAG: hypothetical protein Ct9H300mP8_02590 [Gammaproteobacteria bacterium]|nr:MAG: hypothetical protein Ct9H300mP8_02590 [Gammaproteobacteria bacterium]
MYQAFVEASSDLGNFAHGFTYSGHRMAAVALRNLQLIEERQVFAHAGPKWVKYSSLGLANMPNTLWSEILGGLA